jgi:phosphoribosylanthranilate isomerase
MAPLVKICGVTRADDGAMCARAGADWIGLNFWPQSKRFVARARAAEIAAAVRAEAPSVRLVGVFVNEDPGQVAAIAAEVGLDLMQLHGDEPTSAIAALGERAIAAVRLSSEADIARAVAMPAEAVVLVDASAPGYGGSGELADWGLARRVVSSRDRVILAGGLAPHNLSEAIRAVCPFGVDVASGVESSPGIKDPDRVRAFVEAAKSWQ